MSHLHLGAEEREEIRCGLAREWSERAIVRSLHRSPSTISREVGRLGTRGNYSVVRAQDHAQNLKHKPRRVHNWGSVRSSVCEAERDFSTVPPPAPLRPGASGAVGKSVIILRAGGFKAFGVEDGELVHRLLPVLGGSSPIGGNVAQNQPNQFGRGVIARKVSARLDGFA